MDVESDGEGNHHQLMCLVGTDKNAQPAERGTYS